MFNVIKKLASFNTPNTVVFVSEYDHFAKESTGLSSYSRLTIDELQDAFGTEIEKTVVFSVGKKQNNIVRVVQKGRRIIVPSIKKNNPLTLIGTAFHILSLTDVKNIVIEFEFASYGGPIAVGAFMVLLSIFKLMGKQVYFVIHQAVNGLDDLHVHLGLRKGSPILWILNIALGLFYRMIGVCSEKIVVLEQEIKLRLLHFVDKSKISVIPHAVQKSRSGKQKTIDFSTKTIHFLVFGYIAWYKGLDRFIHAFNHIDDANIKLTIAGGYSPAQRGKRHYEAHYKSVLELAKTNPRITITGYVPERLVSKYYKNADICILPYRKFISSSGPLSQGFTYKKATVISKELLPYMKSRDFKEAMKEAHLDKNDLFVPMNSRSLNKLVARLRTDSRYVERLMNFSTRMYKKRSWKNLIQEYGKLILSGKKSPSLVARSHDKKYHTIPHRYSYS